MRETTVLLLLLHCLACGMTDPVVKESEPVSLQGPRLQALDDPAILTQDAGTDLPETLEVQTLGTDGQPVAGEAVEYRVVEGDSALLDYRTRATDRNGIASAHLHVSDKAGESVIIAEWLPNREEKEDRRVFFHVTSQPGAPATIDFVSGTDQCAEALTAYGDPLVVTVRDLFGNPIPNFDLDVRVSRGKIEKPAPVQPHMHTTNGDGFLRLKLAASSLPRGRFQDKVTVTATVPGSSPSVTGKAALDVQQWTVRPYDTELIQHPDTPSEKSPSNQTFRFHAELLSPCGAASPVGKTIQFLHETHLAFGGGRSQIDNDSTNSAGIASTKQELPTFFVYYGFMAHHVRASFSDTAYVDFCVTPPSMNECPF